MSLLRVYSYNIINQCWYFAQLHILPFYRIEVDKSRHSCVYTHALTSNVARILRNFIVCRQNIHEVDESCRLYVYHRIEVDKACHLLYCAYIHQSNVICDYILSIKSSRQTCQLLSCTTADTHVTSELYPYTCINVCGRPIMSPPRVYSHTSIKRCCCATGFCDITASRSTGVSV